MFRNLFKSKKKKKESLRKFVPQKQKSKRYKFKKKLKVSKFFLYNIKTNFLDKYKYIMLEIFSIAFILFSIGIVFFTGYFNIKSIVLERDNVNLDTLAIEQTLVKYKDTNIFSLNKQQIIQEIHDNFPQIENVSVYKLLPQTLKISVSMYSVVARIREHEGTIYNLNEKGLPLPEIKIYNDLPLIEIINQHYFNQISKSELQYVEKYFKIRLYEEIIYPNKLQLILDTISIFERNFDISIVKTRFYPIENEIHMITNLNFSLWIDLRKDDINTSIIKLKHGLRYLNIYDLNLAYIDLRIPDKIIYCLSGDVCETIRGDLEI